MANDEEAEIYYIGIKDPVELRRNLLETSKHLIQFLKRQEEIKELRTGKAQLIIQLKEETEDITKLMMKLRRSLPKTKIRAAALDEKKEPAEKTATVKSGKDATELDKLESELVEIENRLGTLR